MKACSWRKGGAQNDWQRVSEHKSPVMVASTWSPQAHSLSLKETVRVVATAEHGQCLVTLGLHSRKGAPEGAPPVLPAPQRLEKGHLFELHAWPSPDCAQTPQGEEEKLQNKPNTDIEVITDLEKDNENDDDYDDHEGSD